MSSSGTTIDKGKSVQVVNEDGEETLEEVLFFSYSCHLFFIFVGAHSSDSIDATAVCFQTLSVFLSCDCNWDEGAVPLFNLLSNAP